MQFQVDSWLEKEFVTKCCIAAFLDSTTVSKNAGIHDFTGFQTHCTCQHIQGLKHVHVAFGGGRGCLGAVAVVVVVIVVVVVVVGGGGGALANSNSHSNIKSDLASMSAQSSV